MDLWLNLEKFWGQLCQVLPGLKLLSDQTLLILWLNAHILQHAGEGLPNSPATTLRWPPTFGFAQKLCTYPKICRVHHVLCVFVIICPSWMAILRYIITPFLDRPIRAMGKQKHVLLWALPRDRFFQLRPWPRDFRRNTNMKFSTKMLFACRTLGIKMKESPGFDW